jgi:hypothetical protein
MARIIPNNNTWIGFIPVTSFGSAIAGYPTSWNSSLSQPSITTTELDTAYDITPFVISLTAQSTGNTVPTPTLDSLFEGNIAGTVNASFTMDLYRDDASYTDANTSTTATDFAWTKLPRGQKGYVIVSRYGGTGTNQEPVATGLVELWPVVVTARTAGAVTSNTVQTFTITAAVPFEPAEAATVTSSTSAPSIPQNVVGQQGGVATNPSTNLTFAASGNSLVLDWDAVTGATSYKVFYSTNTSLTGSTAVTTNITFSGTSATIASAGLSASTRYYYVTASNSNGDSLASNSVKVILT